jgi:hypothetical protein
MINPRKILVQVAASQIGVRETSRNAAPELVKYWQATTYPEGMADRQPWCAAFVAWVVFEGMKREPLLAVGDKTRPRSAAVKDWVPWALKPAHGCVVFGPADPKYKPEPGDLVVFKFSHIGVVELGNGRMVQTIEGNTDDEGAREGVRVCRRARKLSECKSFIRLACRAVKAATPKGKNEGKK